MIFAKVYRPRDGERRGSEINDAERIALHVLVAVIRDDGPAPILRDGDFVRTHTDVHGRERFQGGGIEHRGARGFLIGHDDQAGPRRSIGTCILRDAIAARGIEAAGPPRLLLAGARARVSLRLGIGGRIGVARRAGDREEKYESEFRAVHFQSVGRSECKHGKSIHRKSVPGTGCFIAGKSVPGTVYPVPGMA
jgi:hypothetical protein